MDGPRVLLVGDDADFREAAGAALERRGSFAVETAPGSAEALDALDETAFDCVVAAHDLGEETGLDLFDRLRDRGRVVPFVFWAPATEALVDRARSAGVADVVVAGDDPATLAVLAGRVEDAVDRQRGESALGTVLDALPDPVFVLDDDLRLVRWNDAFARRRDGPVAAGDPIMEAVEVLDRDEATEVVRAVLRDDEARQYDATVVDGDGVERTYEVRLSRVVVGGEPRVLGVARDVTARRAAERERRETARRLEEIAENAGDVLWLFDADFSELLYVNSAYESVYGGSVESLRRDARSFLETVHPDDRDDVRAAMARLGDGEPVDVEYRVNPPEYDRWVWVVAEPVLEDGEVVRVAGFSRDVTERRAYEREIETQNERLERMATIVSHDLQSPLSVIEGSIDLARETGDESHLDRADRAVSRIRALTEDILTIAREGDAVEDVGPVRLSAVAERAWDETDTGTAQLVVERDGVVEADRPRLRQLFANLFDNAATHGAPDGGDLTVRVGLADDGDGFYVADDGVGVPEADRETVFEATYSTERGGTGLGLDIVAGIVDAHGWSIELCESEGGGARFDVTAPVAPPAGSPDTDGG